MKRLIAITDEYPPMRGGIANYLRGVLEAFRTYASIRLMLPKDLAAQVDTPFPVDAAAFQSRWVRPTWLPLVEQLIRRTTEQSGDAMLVSHVLPYGTAAWIASRITRRPYIVCVHGLDLAMADLVSRKRRLTERVLRGAAIIVANSEYTLSRALAVAPNTPGVVVYPCPSIVSDPKTVVASPARPFVLAVGRMVSRKGFRTLLRAAKEVVREIPDFRLVMVGDGPERAEILDDRKRLELEEVVEIRSATDDELRTLYAQCSFFVLPTQSSEANPEGFGTVFLEANGFGKAVVAGAGGGVGEAVVDKETGLLVDGRDPNAIAKAILRLWRDPVEAARLGAAGRERVEKRFRYMHTIQPLVDAWNALWPA